MGVFEILYQNEILPGIEAAVTDALKNEVKDAVLEAIEDSATERVYRSYYPSFWSRRMDLASDEGYECEVNGDTLTVTAVTKLQNLWGGSHDEDLGDIIAEGWENFNMPFPRPWMSKGIEERLPQIEQALANGMKRQGY